MKPRKFKHLTEIKCPRGTLALTVGGLLLALGATAQAAPTNEECLGCHAEAGLKTASGRRASVSRGSLAASVHRGLRCVDCHDQPAAWDEVPHFQAPRRVSCNRCHADAAASYRGGFHGSVQVTGAGGTPGCATCHKTQGDSHRLLPLTAATAEDSCRGCHKKETESYDGSVHAAAAAQGKETANCLTCHPPHGSAAPPSAGAVNKLCEQCHEGSMKQVSQGAHGEVFGADGSSLSCASCHDVHATHRPEVDETTFKSCTSCHPGYERKLDGSVHEEFIRAGGMTCVSCHRTHQVRDAKEAEQFACGECHPSEEAGFRKSAHRQARLRGDEKAATCSSCHGGHLILAAKNPESPINHARVPATCGKCHGDEAVITSDYVRLPISMPRYSQSVHGVGAREGRKTAICTDCHNTHDILAGSSPESSIHKEQLARTCGKCHAGESKEYQASVHGKAVMHGIDDSPSCTGCHEEHMILAHSDPRSPVNRQRVASETCGRCHEDPEMAAKYGFSPDVVASYADSYHGWAIQRGGRAVAVCTDCHNRHEIRSALDPDSSINKAHVVATCGRCHPNSNAKFAASYSHLSARGKRMIHDWVQIFYVWLLVLVLGSMALHNLLIYVSDLRRHYRHERKKPSRTRMSRNEVVQHSVLLVTFFSLALSGFALRFPGAWWARALTDIGFTEELRRAFHRAMAATMVAASLYHVLYLAFTKRGRLFIKASLPGLRDVKDAGATLAYYLGKRREKPTYGAMDYTQKAEYWALIWGTIIMSLTGFVLWFPTYATSHFPTWIVRVAEVIHFYEAILAVAAIFIWHFFFVMFKPSVYPMSWIWIHGQMTLEEYHEKHGGPGHEHGGGHGGGHGAAPGGTATPAAPSGPASDAKVVETAAAAVAKPAAPAAEAKAAPVAEGGGAPAAGGKPARDDGAG